jgi:hypothetical protein
MPIVGESQDRVVELLEELVDRIDENGSPANVTGGNGQPIRVIVPKADPPVVNVTAPASPAQAPPTVNVAAPEVTVKPQITVTPNIETPDVHVSAPTVNVEAPKVTVEAPNVTVEPKITVEGSKARSWTFSVKRNKDGFIETITATPR